MPRSTLKPALLFAVLPLLLMTGPDRALADRALADRALADRGRPVSAQPTPKLLEYGWDMPEPSQLARAEELLDASPFDGLTLRLSAGQQLFRQQGLDEAVVAADVKTLQGIRSPKLQSSYLSVYGGSGDGWDWFDDAQWATAEHSARLMARSQSGPAARHQLRYGTVPEQPVAVRGSSGGRSAQLR